MTLSPNFFLKQKKPKKGAVKKCKKNTKKRKKYGEKYLKILSKMRKGRI